MPIQTAPCGYLAFDDDRRITSVNGEALRYLQYQEHELLGQSLDILLPQAVRILFHTTVYPALAGGQPADEVYAVLRCKDGADLPVLLNASRRQHTNGCYTDCVFLAVRRRHAFERHLEQLEAMRRGNGTDGAAPAAYGALTGEFADRMLSLGVLLASVMHELRNPLTHVSMNLDLLTMELDEHPSDAIDPAMLRQRIAETSYGVTRVVDLVKAVGMVSRMEPAKASPVDVSRVVDSAVRLVHHSIARHARIDIDNPAPGPVVLADEARLAQVVMNLLMNAAQALQATRRSDGQIRIRSATTNECAVITVADNGPGVPKALRDRIFDAFYTTKPVGEGTGLGLHISREIVASFAGTLELISSSHDGATFVVTLPLHSIR